MKSECNSGRIVNAGHDDVNAHFGSACVHMLGSSLVGLVALSIMESELSPHTALRL